MTAATPGPVPTRRPPWSLLHRPDLRLVPALVALVFGLLVLTGTTMSSVGAGPLRDDGTAPGRGLLAGTPREIRSDEFLRTSPWRIGTERDPDVDFRSPLTVDGSLTTTVAERGVATRIVFFDSALLSLAGRAGTARGFALVYWLPMMLLLAALPPLLRRIGVPRAAAAGTVALVIFNPAVAWWSLAPVGTGLGGAAAAGLLLWWAAARVARAIDEPDERRRHVLVATACVAVAGPLLVRVPFSYAPWSVLLAGGVLVPALAALVASHARRVWLLVGGATGAWAALLGLGVLVENRTAFRVLGDTVYPGGRREGGASLDLARLFAAPHLGALRHAATFLNASASEISSSYAVLLLPCACAALVLSRGSGSRALRAAWWALAAWLAIHLVWVTVDVPRGLARRIPLLSLTPPPRIGQVIGIPVILLFGLTVARLRDELPAVRRRAAVGAAVSTAIVLAMAGSVLRQFYLPGLGLGRIVAVSVVFALAAAIAFVVPARAWALLPIVALGVQATWFVNPLQVGLGDLDAGATARTVRELHEREPDARWATDSIYLDALLTANAVPSLTGQQWVGPDEEAWRALDPTGAKRQEWNRGASFISFSWSIGTAAPVITNPAPDLIQVVLDPCDAGLDALRVSYLIISGDFDEPCLDYVTTITFGGHQARIYARR